MSKRSKDNQDNDDVLRMEDIVPPFRRTPEKGQPATPLERTDDIPTFDLAEQIMSQQRKQTATRRIAPKTARTAGAEPPSANSAVGSPVPLVAEQQRIIADIVARDIERLCNDRLRK